MLVEQNTLLVEEREREIRQIVQSISDLNEIFRDLGAMIVEQVCAFTCLISGLSCPDTSFFPRLFDSALLSGKQLEPIPSVYIQCVCAQSCLTLCDPMDCSPPGSSLHGILPGKNTGVGCRFLLQGVFPTHYVCVYVYMCTNYMQTAVMPHKNTNKLFFR